MPRSVRLRHLESNQNLRIQSPASCQLNDTAINLVASVRVALPVVVFMRHTSRSCSMLARYEWIGRESHPDCALAGRACSCYHYRPLLCDGWRWTRTTLSGVSDRRLRSL